MRGEAAGYTQTDTAGEGHADCTRKNNTIGQRCRNYSFTSSRRPKLGLGAQAAGSPLLTPQTACLSQQHNLILQKAPELKVEAGISFAMREIGLFFFFMNLRLAVKPNTEHSASWKS